jgi:hypothetical protein
MKKLTSANTIRLSSVETKAWEDGGPDGYAFRSEVRAIARNMARSSGKSVEVYASKTSGGWTADVIAPE